MIAAPLKDPTNPEDFDFSTPMMQQYLSIKKMYSDCLLFFRLGDFYEMFLEDAKVGARVLGITLTSRSRGKDGRIPMAGVPYHAVDAYLAKLIKAGYKVAICEQMTAPDGRSLVEREVIRVVTPGTFLDEKHLTANQHNYVAAVAQEGSQLAISLADVSTGQLLAHHWQLSTDVTLADVVAAVWTMYAPREAILPPALAKDDSLHHTLTQLQTVLYPFASWATATQQPKRTILKLLPQLSPDQLPSPPLTQRCLAALSTYLHETQKTTLTHFATIEPITTQHHLLMDRSTLINLELLTNLRGQDTGSLLQVIDHTQTAMGARLLRDWVARPLAHQPAIEARLAAVEFLVHHTDLRSELRLLLAEITDFQRLLARLSVKLGTPRDLVALATNLIQLSRLRQTLVSHGKIPPLIRQIVDGLAPSLDELATHLRTTLVDEPPVDPKQTGLIRDGVRTEIDELKQTVRHSQVWLAQLEATERSTTGITSLKIRYNQVFGYYIEVSKANISLVPAHYERRQTLVNAERFVTPTLKEHEAVILNAQEKLHALEWAIFAELVTACLMQTVALQTAAQHIATVDCLAGLAEVAIQRRYSRPTLTTNGQLSIIAGRHPVVETVLPPSTFVPNDTHLNPTDRQLLLLTGPNMAGKSVLMRQVALITLLAHLGSFVPADQATISLVDRIFVRSGASDMISAGQSTFMVEMVETAYILKHATPQSLIIMDEIGRGTSTYDGISLAWAIAEHLVSQPAGPKTLFATHYHELQSLGELFPTKVANVHMAITEHDHQPVFLYTLKPGGASHSFGLAVAALAEVPPTVIDRARRLLSELEQGTPTIAPSPAGPSSLPAPSDHPAAPSPLHAALDTLRIDELTPLQALNILAEWKTKYA